MSERIPKGWKKLRLKDVSIQTKGLTYKSGDYADKSSGLPFLTLKSISKSGGYSPEGLKFYMGDFKEHHILRVGDLLFANTDLTREGDVVGSPLYFEGFGFTNKTLYSMDLSRLVVNSDKADGKFLYYLMMTPRIKRFMVNSSAGSTVLHLDTKRVQDLSVTLPPLPEQKKIASILTSVDEVIDSTQKQIDKLQNLKKATMNELLAKGIAHTEFKDSELGEIPKNWGVKKLEEVGQIIGGGTPASENENYWGGEIQWATPREITKLNGRYIEKTERTLTKKGLEESSAKLHPKGTVLLTSRASIGFPAINTVPMATNQGFQSLRPNERLDTEFGYQILLHSRQKLERLSAGSTFLEISSKEVKKFKLSIPPLPEQKKIASILTSMDKNIEDKQRKLHQNQFLKKSLMQDLLTGKVRVKVN